jgi:hypothetical protein
MSDAEHQIHCERHGTTEVTFVCRHLCFGRACGFHDSGAEGEPWPDAWCDKCQKVFDRDGEWTDDNQPELAVVCTGCYEDVKERNLLVPPPLEPGQVEVTEAQFSALARAAYDFCQELQERARERWDFGQKEHWSFDPDERTIRFYDDDGQPSVVADVCVAGSFSTLTKTWMWVFGNEDYSDAERERLAPIRVFGEVRGIRKLEEAHFDADEIDAWELTQIAAYLLGADAVYRAPMDHSMVFMLLENFRMEPPRCGPLLN